MERARRVRWALDRLSRSRGNTYTHLHIDLGAHHGTHLDERLAQIVKVGGVTSVLHLASLDQKDSESM